MKASRRSLRLRRFDGSPISPEVRLDPSSPFLFLSDLHFGDGSRTDLFAGQDARLVDFLDQHRHRVEALVFLGDVIDLPQAGWAKRVIRAHEEVIEYLRELVAARRVIFVRGNHDWWVDYEGIFPGATCCEAVLIGERNLAWHGHQADMHMHPGRAGAMAKTYLHALAERMVGTRLVPPLERHDSRANRVTLSLAVGWARLSLVRAAWHRSRARIERAEALEGNVHYLARSVCGDPADLHGATVRGVLGEDLDAVLCGHSHIPGVTHTDRGIYANTGTWTSGLRTYATWTDGSFVVRHVDSGEAIGDEHYAGLPVETHPQDLFDWWWERLAEPWLRGALA